MRLEHTVAISRIGWAPQEALIACAIKEGVEEKQQNNEIAPEVQKRAILLELLPKL